MYSNQIELFMDIIISKQFSLKLKDINPILSLIRSKSSFYKLKSIEVII